MVYSVCMANIVKKGGKFQNLTFVGYSDERTKDGHLIGEFDCECGRRTKKAISRVVNGYTKTCGDYSHVKGINQTHGMRYHRLYSIWHSMMRRCHNAKSKDFKNYGGRGITVESSWHNVCNFILDMDMTYKKGLSIDRVDNNKGYFKANCRWATNHQQSRNKRDNLKFKGECATDAAKRLGGNRNLVVMRIRRGWSKEKSFNTPIS